MVEAATAASRTAQTELELEFTAAEARFRQEVETERDRRAAEVLAEGRRQAASYDAVPDDRVRALAERALARFLAGIGR